MKIYTKVVVLLCVTVVIGCASTTAVMPAASSKSKFESAIYSGETVALEKQTPGEEIFRVFQEGGSGFVSIGSVRSGVEETATQFCSRKGKNIRPIQETTSTPPHILGNFPRVEWLFECVEQPKTTNSVSVVEQDRYVQLERIKRLLDNGTLSQKEFEVEKSKILSSPK